MLTTQIEKYLQTALVNFMEPYSGWCGSAKCAGNILLGNDISTGYDINKIKSPYQIPDTYSNLDLHSTITLKGPSSATSGIDTSNTAHDTTFNDQARQTQCSSDTITSGPCFGGLSAKGNWSIDSGCDGTNPSYTYPTKGRLPTATKTNLPEIIDHRTGEVIKLGTWVRGSSWGPKNQSNSMTMKSTWIEKLNYSTHILSSSNVSLGVMGSTPSVANIFINMVSCHLTDTGLLGSKHGVRQLCDYVATTIPVSMFDDYIIIDNINQTIYDIGDSESSLTSRRAQVWALIAEAPAMTALVALGPILGEVGIIWMAYATGEVGSFHLIVKTYISKIEQLEAIYFSICPPIIKEIINFYKSITNLSCKTKGGFLEIPKLFCLVDAYKKYTNDYLITIFNYWNDRDIESLKGVINDVYQKALARGKQIFTKSTIMYKPISVSYALINGCDIAGNTSKGNNPFPFAKVGGICSMDGCDEGQNNKYCSCNHETPYTCPFESYKNNLTSCQASLLNIPSNSHQGQNSNSSVPKITSIDLMRKNILYWLNTMVGTNGCFQRSLGMKFGKCIQLDNSSLNISSWNPQNNKFVINSNTDTRLFK